MNPTPVTPPGVESLTTVVNWLAWGVSIACVAGVLLVAGRMALAHRRGEGMEVTGGLIAVLCAAILAGGASGFVAAVL